MKKVKILFFIYQMGGGGAARTLLNIINNLDRSIFSPVLVTLNFNGSYENELRDDVKFIKLDSKRLSRSIFQLAKIIRNERIDLVFSTIPRVNTIAIIATKLSFSKAKCIVREASYLGGTFKENIQLLAFGFMYKFSNQIISLSEGVANNLVNRYKVKRETIKIIYNPVDLEQINNKINNGTIPKEYEHIFQTNEKIIVTAGRLVDQKDHQTLLRAFAKVNDEIKSRLILLGEGELKNDLMNLAEKLNISQRVHFLGFQKNPYIFFNKADLFVLSSKYEGFGHVVAEALATGTPVVSTNCNSGPAEILNNGEFGELVPVQDVEVMANKMKKVLSLSEEKLSSLIMRGIDRCKMFDAKKIVKQYEEIFLQTLSKK